MKLIEAHHLKLVHKPTAESELIMASELQASCNVPIRLFATYGHEMEVLEPVYKFAVAPSRYRLMDLYDDKDFDEDAYTEVLFHKPEPVLDRYIRMRLGDKVQGLVRTEEEDEECYVKLRIITFSRPVVEQGFYYERAGWHLFYDRDMVFARYGKYQYWGRQQDFEDGLEQVLQQVDYYLDEHGPKGCRNLVDGYRMEFIDDFELGRSLLHFDWTDRWL